MLLVLLRFSDNKGRASQLIEGQKEWIKRGFDDGAFLLAGSLQPNWAVGLWRIIPLCQIFKNRVNEDPFVAENVVSAEILEITPSRTHDGQSFFSAE